MPNDCLNYIQACSNQNIAYDVSGFGTQEIASCGSEEHNSLWLRVTIEQSGTLGFILKPTSTAITEDYDFWVFGPNSDCNNLGTPIRCSTTNPEAINQHDNYTGMVLSASDFFEGPGDLGNSFVKQINVLAGENYFFVIDRPIGNSSFSLNWNGSAVISNPFNTQNFNDFENIFLCDPNNDNLEPYNFSNLTSQYLGSITGYQVSYFNSSQNASLNSNELIGETNISPGIYYARIQDQNSACFILKPIEVTFNNKLPLLIMGCDDDYDGLVSFDTSTLEQDLLGGVSGFDLSYTDQNNNTLPSPLPNPFTTSSQIINVLLTSNSGIPCSFNATVEFIVNAKPIFNAVSPTLVTLCNENSPTEAIEFASFDTSSLQSTIIGSQSNIIVEYYDENNNQLSTPLPNPFSTSSQNVTVKLLNTSDLSCNVTGIIPFKVLSLPKIELIGDEVFVCTNLPNYFVTLNAGLLNPNQQSNYSYDWYLNNNLINGATNYNLQVNQSGNYSVKVFDANGCQNTRTILVKESNIAAIENVIITDFTNDNNLVVVTTGIGDYLYSLDNVIYQSSNTFSNLSPGVYKVYVKDINGCGITNKEVSIYGAPRYFTPNGDGNNDYWNIVGVNTKLKQKINIKIFDRYGKLLDLVNPLKAGWDGMFNNRQLPSDDYWYVIELDNERIVKGHFSLIR